jgi:hydroxymethylglutaryl-CoA reductase (NADPH)
MLFPPHKLTIARYVPVPVGVVGPLLLDGHPVRVPLATTEGALVASTNRGCRAITLSGGARSVILSNGMTRAPLVRFPSMAEAAALKAWLGVPENASKVAQAFNSTTRFGKLQSVGARVAGRNIYIRFACNCGDAMGMNMVTKGTVAALEVICEAFPNAKVVSLSGNVCSDKKPAAVNWIEGRGRSVACEVVLSKAVVEKTLKTTVQDLMDLNVNKNLVGSAMSGSLGGFNAHASNIVSALFLATGNDIAQNVESSSCITLMERDGENLHMSVTMPSVEVGTVGGGTTLPAQAACLDLMGCAGANRTIVGAHADQLARVVAAAVLAGELSLMAALASGDLLESHMKLNRRKE